MNQTTNLIQWKNLTAEEKAAFEWARYRYDVQNGVTWKHLDAYGGNFDNVYRLVVEEDKWYALVTVNNDLHFEKGALLLAAQDDGVVALYEYSTLRPAKPSEIPKPEPTLEDRVKAEYPDYEVVVLEFDEPDIDGVSLLCVMHNRSAISHVLAQSMRGFSGYVYERNDDDSFSVYPWAVDCMDKNIGDSIYTHPIAALFTKATK